MTNKNRPLYDCDEVEITTKIMGEPVHLIKLEKVKIKDANIENNFEKDPDLILICHVNIYKIYYNINNDSFIMMAFHPRTRELLSYGTLEDHDIDTLLAFTVVHKHLMESSLVGKRQYLNQGIRAKIELFNARFHQKEPKKRRV